MEAVTFDKRINNIEAYLQILEYRLQSLEATLPSRVPYTDTLDVTKEGIVLIDCFATWCAPCYEIQPSLEQIAKEMEESGNARKYNMKFYRIDIDKHPEIGKQIIKDLNLKELHIPLLIVYRDGKIVTTLTGAPRNKKLDIIRWLIWRALVPQQEWDKTNRIVQNVAKAMGWHLNPNKFLVDGLISALTYNKLNYGKYYCPCKPQHVKENICPCKPFGDFIGSKERIQTQGICYCGLFVSDEYLERYNKGSS